MNAPRRGGEDDVNLVYQANGSASFRRGAVTLASSDDNGSNQVVIGFDKYKQTAKEDVTGTISAGSKKHNNADVPHVAHALRSEGADASEDGTGRGTPLVVQPYIVNAAESCAKESHARETDVARCIDGTGSFANAQGGTVVAFSELGEGHQSYQETETASALRTPSGSGGKVSNLIAFKESQSGCREGRVDATLDANKGSRRQEGIVSGMVVRRLTPTECLRLQGLPDNYLDLNPPLSDSAKYRMIGNSGVRQVVNWIARRMREVHEQFLECEGTQ